MSTSPCVPAVCIANLRRGVAANVSDGQSLKQMQGNSTTAADLIAHRHLSKNSTTPTTPAPPPQPHSDAIANSLAKSSLPSQNGQKRNKEANVKLKNWPKSSPPPGPSAQGQLRKTLGGLFIEGRTRDPGESQKTCRPVRLSEIPRSRASIRPTWENARIFCIIYPMGVVPPPAREGSQSAREVSCRRFGQRIKAVMTAYGVSRLGRSCKVSSFPFLLPLTPFSLRPRSGAV
jgi:hypothetical protein